MDTINELIEEKKEYTKGKQKYIKEKQIIEQELDNNNNKKLVNNEKK